MARHHLPAAAFLVLACFGACNLCLAEDPGAETPATMPAPAPEDVDSGQITNAQFYRLVEVLRVSMRDYDIPLSARNELLAMLAPVKREAVER